MSLVIGCPIKDRAWIVGAWAEALQRALEAAIGAGVEAGLDTVNFVLVGDPSSDPRTFEALDHSLGDYEVVEVVEAPGRYRRDWNQQRFAHLASLRNRLLGRVRELAPDRFWSVDSDVLVHPQALLKGLEVLAEGRFAAVGQRCYMSLGVRGSTPWCTSCATVTPFGGLIRETSDGVIPAQVIMASKLMTPAAYSVDYAPHPQGEDIGWSLNCHRAGLELGWDGRFTSTHVLERPA